MKYFILIKKFLHSKSRSADSLPGVRVFLKFSLGSSTLLLSMIGAAQDSSSAIQKTIPATGQSYSSQPWTWIVGSILILIIILFWLKSPGNKAQ